MIFDGHSDIWADVNIRVLNGERNIIKNHHLERLKSGSIEGGIFVIWIDPPYTDNPKKRLGNILDSIEVELKDCSDELLIVKNFDDIYRAKKENKLYIVKGMEGLSGLNPSVESIEWIYGHDVRHASLTWNEENAFATGVLGDSTRGLTNLGKAAVKKIISKGIVLDVSHANEKSFWDVVDIADVPIVASHSNARAICDVPRNLDDKQLKAVRDLGGLVGINAFHLFINDDKSYKTLEGFVQQMAYISDLIGVEHVGFGFDFDGFLPAETMSSYAGDTTVRTEGLEDCSKIPQLISMMGKYGFSEREIEKISRENWLRVLKTVIK